MYQQKYQKYKSKYLKLQNELQEGGKLALKILKDGQSKYLFQDIEKDKGKKIMKKYGLDKIEVESEKIIGKDKKTIRLFIAKKYPNLIFKYITRRSKKNKHIKKSSLVYRNRPASITFADIENTKNPTKQFAINLNDSESSESSSEYDGNDSPSDSSSSSDFYTPKKKTTYL